MKSLKHGDGYMTIKPRSLVGAFNTPLRQWFAPFTGMSGSTRALANTPAVPCAKCNVDWRGRCEAGGLLFDAEAICPDCAPTIWDRIRASGAEYLVEDFPRAGETFADACQRWRDGPSRPTPKTSGQVVLKMVKS
jgi:hypothetical protein